MKNLFRQLKNLLKLYDVLIGRSLIINTESLLFGKDKWHYVSVFIKKEKDGSIVVDDLSIFQFKTEKRTKTVGKKLKAYYKLEGDGNAHFKSAHFKKK